MGLNEFKENEKAVQSNRSFTWQTFGLVIGGEHRCHDLITDGSVPSSLPINHEQ